jgi:hypothetical protein
MGGPATRGGLSPGLTLNTDRAIPVRTPPSQGTIGTAVRTGEDLDNSHVLAPVQSGFSGAAGSDGHPPPNIA